jgi:hypothetical protein
LNVIPVIQTAHIANFGNESNLKTAVDSWLDRKANPFVAGIEVHLKEPHGILSSLQITHDTSGNRIGVGSFQPTNEDPNYHGPPSGARFRAPDAYCCIPISKYYFNGTELGLPSDHDDLRYSESFLHDQGISLITSDRYKQWMKRLDSLGERDIQLLQRPLQQITGSQSSAPPQRRFDGNTRPAQPAVALQNAPKAPTRRFG